MKDNTLEDFANNVELLEEDVIQRVERDVGLDVRVSEEVLVKVTDWLRSGISTSVIRSKLGISSSKDIKWKRIQQELRGFCLSEDYLMTYVGRNEHIYNELRRRYERLCLEEEELASSGDEVEAGKLNVIRKLINDTLKQMKEVTHGVLKTGVDIGSIEVKEKDTSVRPIVVVNNIPRPTMLGEDAPNRQVRNGKDVLIIGGK